MSLMVPYYQHLPYMILSSIVFITKTHNYISEYLLHLRNLSTEVNEHNYENWEVFNETSANTSSECRIWHPGIAVSLPADRLFNSFLMNSFASSSENNTHELTSLVSKKYIKSILCILFVYFFWYFLTEKYTFRVLFHLIVEKSILKVYFSELKFVLF